MFGEKFTTNQANGANAQKSGAGAWCEKLCV